MLLVVALLFFASVDAGQQLREGLIALQKNDLAHARELLESASRALPESAEVWVALAQTYRKMGLKDSAISSATTAERFAQKSPPVLHALAIFYAEAAQFRKAADLESRYAQANDRARAGAADLWMKAGAGDEANGDLPKAATAYRRAVEMAPLEEAYQFALAQAYLKQQQFQPAIDLLGQSRKAFPNSAQIELALGVAYYGQRRFKDAVNSFLRTIDLAPDVEQPYVFLGRMLDQAGDRMGEVLKRVEAWSSANPENALAQFVYARATILSGGDQAKAEQLLRRSIDLKADQWESHYELGTLFERQRKFAEAATELERSVALNAIQADVHYHLARVYDRLGEREKAAAERRVHEQLAAGSGVR
jgi:tetratricopeptide (TPR) repeat protein